MVFPKFLYFDLGNVLVTFSGERMFRQVAGAAGVDAAVVKDAIYHSGLQRDLELGRITGREFCESFCRQSGTRVDYRALQRAGSDIFELNLPILPLVSGLRQAGYRLGILSNTCESHWEHCRGKFSLVGEMFGAAALSCRIGAMKPDVAIFQAAAELAGHRPQEIFFVDDLPEHVAGARAVGFDAVQYASTAQLAADLRKRGLEFNY